MLSKIFKPKYSYDLVRLGSKHDGGYLIEFNSLNRADFLFSFGISTNWDFEESFLKYNKINFIAFDASINEEFWNKLREQAIRKTLRLSFSKLFQYFYLRKRFKNFFDKDNLKLKYISQTMKNSLTMSEVLSYSNFDNNFFKIDIEGSEYEILEDIIYHQNRIIGLAIEFHECRLNINKIENFIKKFSLSLVHIHANNYDKDHNLNIPKTLEITFAKNPKIIGKFKKLPHPLDKPNRAKSSEVNIKFNE